MIPRPRNVRGLLLAAAGTALVIACSSAPESGQPKPAPANANQPQYPNYPTWLKLMESEMGPIQDTFTPELTKDPEDTDYQLIGNWSRRAAHYFTLFSNKHSNLYDEDEDYQKAAQEARRWLLQMATAADRKEQGKLVRLMGRRQKICTQCHDDVGG